MARKHNENNPLQIRIEAVSLPPHVTPRRYFSELIRAMDTGSDLPRGWEVRLHWRNPNTQYGATRHWRSDEFMDAVADSRDGFNAIVRDALVRRLRGTR